MINIDLKKIRYCGLGFVGFAKCDKGIVVRSGFVWPLPQAFNEFEVHLTLSENNLA